MLEEMWVFGWPLAEQESKWAEFLRTGRRELAPLEVQLAEAEQLGLEKIEVVDRAAKRPRRERD